MRWGSASAEVEIEIVRMGECTSRVGEINVEISTGGGGLVPV